MVDTTAVVTVVPMVAVGKVVAVTEAEERVEAATVVAGVVPYLGDREVVWVAVESAVAWVAVWVEDDVVGGIWVAQAAAARVAAAADRAAAAKATAALMAVRQVAGWWEGVAEATGESKVASVGAAMGAEAVTGVEKVAKREEAQWAVQMVVAVVAVLAAGMAVALEVGKVVGLEHG